MSWSVPRLFAAPRLRLRCGAHSGVPCRLRPRHVLHASTYPAAYRCATRICSEKCTLAASGDVTSTDAHDSTHPLEGVASTTCRNASTAAESITPLSLLSCSSDVTEPPPATRDDAACVSPSKHVRRGWQHDTVRTILERQAASPRPLASAETDVLNYDYAVVDSPEALAEVSTVLAQAHVVAMDIEALCKNDSSPQLGTVSLLQLCSDANRMVYIIDVLTLTPTRVSPALRPLLTDPHITKLAFDCRRDAEALSCQLHIVPRGLVDLQLYHTALQWRQRSVSRRSSMRYVLRQLTGVTRGEETGTVHAAMTQGNAAVWDRRPLPSEYLRYAADDVRHLYLLWCYLTHQKAAGPSRHSSEHDSNRPNCSTSNDDRADNTTSTHDRNTSANITLDSSTSNTNANVTCSNSVPVDSVRSLTERYVAHYAATGKPVTVEADPLPTEVHVGWLQECIGAGGLCAFCGAKGHVEVECFRRIHGVMRCTFCGHSGHTAAHCYRRDPQLRKCALCGQVGHNPASCFRNNPCRHCGGNHKSEDCRRRPRRAQSRPGSAGQEDASMAKCNQLTVEEGVEKGHNKDNKMQSGL